MGAIREVGSHKTTEEETRSNFKINSISEVLPMKVTRRIQLTAAAVIANGALALAITLPVQAGTCGPTFNCVSRTDCLVTPSGYCYTHRPAGCTYVSKECGYPLQQCDSKTFVLICHYQ